MLWNEDDDDICYIKIFKKITAHGPNHQSIEGG